MSLHVVKKCIVCMALLMGLAACDRTVVIAPDAVLPNGAKYLGKLKNDKFHGQGKLIFAEGGYYQGQFENGLYHGRGDYLTPEGSRYQGLFKRGRVTGKFKVYDAYNDQNYEGDLVDFVYQGQGRLESKGTLYIGGFRNYLYHGEGRLSNENGVYTGQFVDGSFTGEGRIDNEDGSISEGEFKDWLLFGNGKTISAEGDVLEGDFEAGYLSGKGRYISETRGSYEGEFEYSQFNGQGTYTQPDGAVYVGEFEYGQYHGEGTLTPAPSSGGAEETNAPASEAQIISGKWRYGRPVGSDTDSAVAEQQAEYALANHQRLLGEQIDGLANSDDAKPNAYFIGLAGDGTQSVFRKEIDVVGDFFVSHYGTEQRQIRLVNDHETAETRALATRLAFKQSVASVAEKANLASDVLVVYVSSHGSSEHSLSIKHDALKLPDLSGEYLAEVLTQSGFKHKFVMVSACYSGGYIPLLDDGNSLIITASSDVTTSFGCSDTAELTYFGRALFGETLSQQPELTFTDAFTQAKILIDQWEKEEELEASEPKIRASAKVSKQLALIRASNQL